MIGKKDISMDPQNIAFSRGNHISMIQYFKTKSLI